MVKITKEAALLYHSQGKPGKIEVIPTKPYQTQRDLSLAYSPGVRLIAGILTWSSRTMSGNPEESGNSIRLYSQR